MAGGRKRYKMLRSARRLQRREDAKPTPQCLLFTLLPQEIRDQIYNQVFAQARLTYAKSDDRWFSPLGPVKPHSNSLALLRTCHRIRAEIGDSWLGSILFNFHDKVSMLDKLTNLPDTIISKIRHMRIRCLNHDLELRPFPDRDHPDQVSLASALKLIPSLQLDTLTVVCDDLAWLEYHTVDCLVRYSNGWKELRCFSSDSGILGANFHESTPYVRHLQPSHWQGVMLERDDHGTAPSVAIYRPKTGAYLRYMLKGGPGSIDWEPYEQKVFVSEFERQRFQIGDLPLSEKDIMSKDEYHKPILIVVRRGKGVDYQEKINSPFIEEDIREVLLGKTWNEIREVYTEYGSRDDGEAKEDYYGDINSELE